MIVFFFAQQRNILLMMMNFVTRSVRLTQVENTTRLEVFTSIDHLRI